jgi:putative oxidoreductase
MKKDKIIYWTTTGILAGVMLWSGINFALYQKDAFAHLGLPNWFRLEPTTAKMLGALALLIPAVPEKIKEFAYFGFGLTLISAPIAHIASGDSIFLVIGHLMFTSVLIVSYLYYRRIKAESRFEIAEGVAS